MTSDDSCPDVRELERLLLGRLPPAEAEPIAQHLRHCDRCAQAVQKLPGEVAPVIVRSTDETQLPEGYADRLAPAAAPGEIGRLGNYRITNVLGSGAMAVVFQAEDLRLGREVALKVLRPVMADGIATRRRFLREARATATLDHENIIAVYQADEDRGLLYLAMPLLKGETLHAILRRQKEATPPWLPTADVLRIGREIAAGLAAAHERGLIHRDIKPANIWLEQRAKTPVDAAAAPTAPPRVKLLDFGIVRVADEDQRLTASGALIGTPAYMAPEQAVGGKIDHRCDLFSLGCVLYRMATGQLAFNGPSQAAIVNAVKSAEPTPPQELNPALPQALVSLLRQMLAKDREQRPANALAVVAALRAIEEAGPDQPIDATPRSAPVTETTPLAPAIPRGNAVWLLLGLVGALIALAAAWRLFG